VISSPARIAALVLVAGLGPASAQVPGVPIWPPEQERDGFFDPPLPLSQEITGVIRASVAAAPVVRIERIRDVFPAIRACWSPAGQGDGQLTVRLAFRRDGTIMGAPRVTYSKLAEPEARRSFGERVFAAIDRCAPLPFSASFGAAVAGRPFTFRFIDDRSI
jgi:hypothetical protein